MNELEQISGITARLNTLEKKNNFLRKMNLILIVLIILIPVLGFQITNQFFKVIETEKLILKDKKGRERAVLFMDEDVVKFRLKNSKDSVMCMMGASEENGYININNESGNNYINIETQKIEIKDIVNSNIITLGSYNRSMTFGLKVEDYENAVELQSYCLLLRDRKDTQHHVGIFQNRITMYEKKLNVLNQKRIELVNDDYGAYFKIYDKKSNLRTSIGNTTTIDNKGRTINNPESTIYLFDENGNGIFQAPQ